MSNILIGAGGQGETPPSSRAGPLQGHSPSPVPKPARRAPAADRQRVQGRELAAPYIPLSTATFLYLPQEELFDGLTGCEHLWEGLFRIPLRKDKPAGRERWGRALLHGYSSTADNFHLKINHCTLRNTQPPRQGCQQGA